MNKKLTRWIIIVVILGVILYAASIFSFCVGSAAIPLKKIIPFICGGRGSAEYSILVDIRLPRIVLGFAVGAALSLAGVILQGLFRNPLVEPYTLGISGGAALGVCINIIFGLHKALGAFTLPVSGFLGAILIMLLLYFLSMRKGIFKIQGILLTGVMISFICSSLIMLIMALGHTDDLQGIVFWIMGSLEEPNLTLIKFMCAVSIAGLIISYLFCLDLNALSLGEEESAHLGINTQRTQRSIFILSSILTGCAVSVAGIIGFVGLVVPHLMRRIVGPDQRILLVSSFFCGAIFLIFCDALARIIIAPLELPVGVITGILGGIIFIYAFTKTLKPNA